MRGVVLIWLVVLVGACGGQVDARGCADLARAEQTAFFKFVESNRACTTDSDCSAFVPPPGPGGECFYTAVATSALLAADAYWAKLTEAPDLWGCRPQTGCPAPTGGPFVTRCEAGSCVGQVDALQ